MLKVYILYVLYKNFHFIKFRINILVKIPFDINFKNSKIEKQ